MKSLAAILFILVFSSLPAWANTQEADGWISHPQATADKNPVVLNFRRDFTLDKKPKQFPLRVTADNRFILYVNGQRVATGPSTGTIDHWRQSSIDISRQLQSGKNVLAVLVWNGVKPIKYPANASEKQIKALQGAALFNQTAPSFQQSVATGLRIVGLEAASMVSTSQPGWQVRVDSGHSFTNGWRQVKGWYYVAGQPEIIDAGKKNTDWLLSESFATDWVAATSAPEAAKRHLVMDKLPAQKYLPVNAGKVVRSDLPQLSAFPRKSVVVPANTKTKLLLQRDTMISAYSELSVKGGANSTIKVTYSEALYDKKRHKADRNLIEDRVPIGPYDTYLLNGEKYTFAPLWWRTWRYLELDIETKDDPLTLVDFKLHETGYPFTQVASFDSSDAQLGRIFAVGWRTAEVDAHETYMDTAFWEQLQYSGDTRLQMLISYVVTGDARLAEQAIDAFASSHVEGGLMESAYPTRTNNTIAPFALLWVGMLDDWTRYQTDIAPVVRHLERMREVLDWFNTWQQPSGLLGKNPQWNFIDWVGQLATDRDKFPSWGTKGESCLMSVTWLGALQQGARIEQAHGDKVHAARFGEKAEKLAQAIKKYCWSQERQLFADNPDLDMFSQHMNAMAIMYDLVDQTTAQQILDKVVAPGKGIDAPEGITTTSYYFAWYLIQAHVHAGLADRYLDLLKTWRELLALNYTTWPEERGNTRSDSHAWSAHPTADLVEVVAGIRPAAPGYSRVKIAPAFGSLKYLDASAPTPSGVVKVRYRIKGKQLHARISLPKNLQGEFHWKGQVIPLVKASTTLKLDL